MGFLESLTFEKSRSGFLSIRVAIPLSGSTIEQTTSG